MNSEERSQVDEARTWDLQEQARKDHQARMIALVADWRRNKLENETAYLQERARRGEERRAAALARLDQERARRDQVRRLEMQIRKADERWAAGAGHGAKEEGTSHRDLVQHAQGEARRIEEGTINNGKPRCAQGAGSYLSQLAREIWEGIRERSLSAVGLRSCMERFERPVCDRHRSLFGRRVLSGYAVKEELLFGSHANLLHEASLGYSSLNGEGDDDHTLKIRFRVVLRHLKQSFTARDRDAELDAFVAAHLTTNLTENQLKLPIRTPKLETDVCHCWEHSKCTRSDGCKEDLLQYIERRGVDAYAVGILVADNNGVDVQNFLSTIFGGFVVLSFTNLIGTSKGDYPEFIRLGLYVGYVLLVVLTFLGLTTKKMAKPAMRVAAGMSIAAVTISAVYEVSDKVYIRSFVGILGAIGTLAMAVVKH